MSPAEFFAPHEKLPRAWPGALVLSVLWLAAAILLAATHYLPTHDAIGWHGLFHYYAEVLGRGDFPWWNPYSRGGEPFFPNLQLIGLLQPTYLAFVALQHLAGLDSVTAFALHYFFQIHVFILGVYLTAHFLARNAFVGLLCALIALGGMLPAMFIQNGVMNGCTYIPLMHYFALRFFDGGEAQRRGRWLFAFTVAGAIGVNAWIAAPMLLFLTCMAAGLLISGGHLLRDAYGYLRSRAGRGWLAASLLLPSLLVAPVVALFLEFRVVDELFPLVRLLQHGDLGIPQCFASDLRSNLFSESFTQQLVISMSSQNLAGLFFEPITFLAYREVWDIAFFAGAFTLSSAALGLVRASSPWKAGIVFLLVLALLAAVNFSENATWGPPHFLQQAVRTLLPFMRLTEVVQIHGALMFYALILLGALGMRFFAASIPALLAAIALPLALKFIPEWGLLEWSGAMPWVMTGSAALGVAACAIPAMSPGMRRAVLAAIAFSIFAVELLIFNAFYLVEMQRASPDYYAYLKRAGLLEPGAVPAFATRREPYAFGEQDRQEKISGRLPKLVTLYGRDAMEHKKSALPNAMRMYTGAPDEWRSFPPWDHVFATRYYYDYLANVEPPRQLALSGVTCPLLRVLGRHDVAVARSPAEAAALLNSDAPGAPHLVLTSARYSPSEAAAVAAERCFQQRIGLGQSELLRGDFARALGAACQAPGRGAVEVLRHDENSLTLRASAPAEGGFLYYADGFSKHWRAFVDGAEVPVFVANLAYKAVHLPPGTHGVEFRYRPVLYRASVQLYYLGLILAAAVLAWVLLRRTGRPASSPSA